MAKEHLFAQLLEATKRRQIAQTELNKAKEAEGLLSLRVSTLLSSRNIKQVYYEGFVIRRNPHRPEIIEIEPCANGEIIERKDFLGASE